MYMGYASLVSLAQTLDQIFCHSQNQLLYDKHQIESLREKVGFLQEFLEDCDQRGIEVPPDMENQMKNLAQRAEDIIETKLVDDILGNYFPRPSKSSSIPIPPEEKKLFCPNIKKLIRNFDSIKKMVLRMEESEDVLKDVDTRKYHGTSSSGLPPSGKISGMVGFKQHLIRVMDELTGHQHKRQILTIVGMGGIGKTTLCRNVYENPLIVQHFHISAWITVSQEYSVREIILRLLCEIRASVVERENQETTTQSFEEMRDDQLGEQLHKGLSGRKYLIVMDDIWGVEVWDEVKCFYRTTETGAGSW